ncbi:hypothetical protein Sjap_013992 [Stephania japonica]|uniref:Pentatricopeptide repeat-containing protein n=1 Tax=Stephania japonica TaxID=461633 RepID=A0AAP0P0I5_9MAGN
MQPLLKPLQRNFFCSWSRSESIRDTLSRLSIEGRLEEAIRALRSLSIHDGFQLNSDVFTELIRSCIKHRAFSQGREIHQHIVDSGIKPDVILHNNVMTMYSKCGDFKLARQVFDEMPERNVFSWTAIIGAYVNNGDVSEAFELYKKMCLSGIRADHFLYPIVLKSCAGMKSLKSGRKVHADVIRSGFQWDLVVMNSLIDMYAKSESLGDSKRVFGEMGRRDIYTWTGMIAGYVQSGCGVEALEFFREMMVSGVRPSSATFAGILPVFFTWGFLELVKQIHGLVVVNGCDCDRFVGTAIVDVYASCGGLGYGRLIFDRMKERDVVCWNTMIKGCAQTGLFDEVVQLLKCMRIDGVNPNRTTWECVISDCLQSGMSIHGVLEFVNQLGRKSVVSTEILDQLCESVGKIEQVREFHQLFNCDSYKGDSYLASILIRLYSKFSDVGSALEIFNSKDVKDLDCWNSMIECYARNKHPEKALELFGLMQKEGLEPSLHSWNSVISGFIDVGDNEAALEMFSEMKWASQNPDSVTLETVIPIVGSITNLMIGKQLHNVFLRSEFEMSRYACTTFINMYANCGDVAHAVELFEYIKDKDSASWNAIISGLAKNGFLDEASKVFSQMRMTGLPGNIITWTALVSGYAQNGQADESLKFFRELQSQGLKPNSTTVASVLPACAHSATISHGKSIHGYILRYGLGYDDLFVTNALIGMYVKCGLMDCADGVFRRMHQSDVVSWNTMIHGLAIHGQASAALTLFDEMLKEGIAPPNGVTFIGVLNACSHAGLVDKGWKLFNSMESSYRIIPSGKHYACMVDLLGRGGYFDDVRNFIVQMPLKPTASLWGALLSACKIHGNLDMAEYAANRLIELQPDNPGNYVMLSNIYATAGRWNEVDRLRKMMIERGVRKLPGCSWIEIGSSIHAFTVENMEAREMEDINRTLLDLAVAMNEEGYAHDMPSFNDEYRIIEMQNRRLIEQTVLNGE